MSPLVTLQELTAVAPQAKPGDLRIVEQVLNSEGRQYGLDNRRAVVMLLGQLFVESAGFTRFEENLNYSAVRLTQVWPKRFPTISAAAPFARNPEALANNVYGNRMGNTQIGDGWRYRGRGPKQITGRNNYREIGKILGVDLEGSPELLEDLGNGMRAALAFWRMTNCREFVPNSDVRGLSRRINGGDVGLDDRIAQTSRIRRIMGA